MNKCIPAKLALLCIVFMGSHAVNANRLVINVTQDNLKKSTKSMEMLAEEVNLTSNSNALDVQYSYFELKPASLLSDRIYIDPDNGDINFHITKGPLKDNVIALLNETRGGSKDKLIWAVADHEEAIDYWVTRQTIKEIAQALVQYHTSPEQVKFGLYTNGIVSIYYPSDKEFN